MKPKGLSIQKLDKNPCHDADNGEREKEDNDQIQFSSKLPPQKRLISLARFLTIPIRFFFHKYGHKST